MTSQYCCDDGGGSDTAGLSCDAGKKLSRMSWIMEDNFTNHPWAGTIAAKASIVRRYGQADPFREAESRSRRMANGINNDVLRPAFHSYNL